MKCKHIHKYYRFPNPKCINQTPKNSDDQLDEKSWSHAGKRTSESRPLNEENSSVDLSKETNMSPD